MVKENCLVDLVWYKSYLDQLIKENTYIKESINENEGTSEKFVYAKRDDTLLCSQKLYEKNDNPAEYYIYADPHPDDAKSPTKRMRIELTTPAEVQAFMDGLKAAGLLKKN